MSKPSIKQLLNNYLRAYRVWVTIILAVLVIAVAIMIFFGLDRSQRWVDSTIKAAQQLNLAGRSQEAQKKYQQIVDEYPNQLTALNALGNILREQGDLKGAEEKYLRVIEADASYEPVYRNLWATYQMWSDPTERTEKLSGFAKIIERGLALQPNSLSVLSTAVDYYRIMGDNAKSAALQQRIPQSK